jgi:hypothetical protein
MYLDMVLTLIAWLSPRSREANIFLGMLFRKNIYQFWIAGMAAKTISIYIIMSIFALMPNIGILLMCIVGGGGFTVCLMNFMTVLSFLKPKQPIREAHPVEPVNRHYILSRKLMPIPVWVAPKKVRVPIRRKEWSPDELGSL